MNVLRNNAALAEYRAKTHPIRKAEQARYRRTRIQDWVKQVTGWVKQWFNQPDEALMQREILDAIEQLEGALMRAVNKQEEQ